MRRLQLTATALIVTGAWTLAARLDAEQATYGHCRDDVGEFPGHSFVGGPTGTVCRTCEGNDGGGCHTSFYYVYSCGPGGAFVGHGDCPGH